MIRVDFTFDLGLSPVASRRFSRPRLRAFWDDAGHATSTPTDHPMHVMAAPDGGARWTATIAFPQERLGSVLEYQLVADGPAGPDRNLTPHEVPDPLDTRRARTFRLSGDGQREHAAFSRARALGANPCWFAARRGVRFSVWAPNARAVTLLIGHSASGYIGDDGTGCRGRLPMFRSDSVAGWDGVWETQPYAATVPVGFESAATPTAWVPKAGDETPPSLLDYDSFEHRPYLFEIVRDDGSRAMRTDLYSRAQSGAGRRMTHDPLEPRVAWDGTADDLDGTVSCSVVHDPDRLAAEPGQVDEQGRFAHPTAWVDADRFWLDEHNPAKPVPTRVEDLVIYELHVGALGAGRRAAGTLADALQLLDVHLVPLGVNCVELMPVSEHRSSTDWGYSTSHFFAIESSIGGAELFAAFVKACHRRGVAVLLDVVYNHYHHVAERAQSHFDSPAPERDIYYWYEGRPSDHPTPEGGYLENWSTGKAPRYWEEQVRSLFTSSALAFMDRFHVDGFRVDQTTSIREYNTLSYQGGGPSVPSANQLGAKFLREWTAAVRELNPNAILTAEDHSNERPSRITMPLTEGGLGFDATWYSDFYHHLIGDTKPGDASYAKLLISAARTPSGPLHMSWFGGALVGSTLRTVVYPESHDEAGNSEGGTSMRTIRAAVNGAPLLDPETERWALARARFAMAVSLLSAGTPLFFMGEEVAAEKPFRYWDFVDLQAGSDPREDYLELRRSERGAAMFRCTAALVALRAATPALRSRNLELVATHDDNRVLAFRRWADGAEWLVVANLAERDWDDGYVLRHGSLPKTRWVERFNSDSRSFGGWGMCNDAPVQGGDGWVELLVPRVSVVAFEAVRE